MKPHELQKLPFQRADRVPWHHCATGGQSTGFSRSVAEVDRKVQWIKADDDIPEGHIGQVMGIKYGEVA